MKVHLLYPDRDLDLTRKLPWNATTLTQDLELNTLFGAMSGGDKFLSEVARIVVLSSFDADAHTIRYRQDILKDCLQNRHTVQALYDIASEAIDDERKHYLGILTSPSWTLHRSIEVLQVFVSLLAKMKNLSDREARKFSSEGFEAFFGMIALNLDDAYFARIRAHLAQLKFREGVLVSARLGSGSRGVGYVLLRSLEPRRNPLWRWLLRLVGRGPPGLRYELPPRDEAGAQALSRLNGQGINLVANALAQSCEHVLSFFQALKNELAFYLGCARLHEGVSEKDGPICFPMPTDAGAHELSFEGLYDVCLSLHMPQRVVGNDLKADGKDIVVVTGANQGGKSTFLRSIGLAQIMMQSGMFAPARSFRSGVCDNLFTHYKREEDGAMESGKLDEELSRMSEIVEHITPHSIVLFNESFAATNEREGSEISRQIVSALSEGGPRIFFVTHLYDFARRLFAKRRDNAIFLRAERKSDGQRPFKLVEGEPLQTSYGGDLYHQIFNVPSVDARPAEAARAS